MIFIGPDHDIGIPVKIWVTVVALMV